MPAIDNTMIANILGATTPTGAAGIPGAFTVLAASAMRIRINSTASTGAAAGTEIPTQTSGYTNGTGWVMTGASTTSGTPAVVGVPSTTFSLVSIGGVVASPGIVSLDLTSSAGVRAWYGNFNAQPIAVGTGNTFQVTGGAGAAAGIQISLT
jgi:hypothetical protein